MARPSNITLIRHGQSVGNACNRNDHDLIKKVIHTKCWAVDIIEYHCKHCSYKEHSGYKINYD